MIGRETPIFVVFRVIDFVKFLTLVRGDALSQMPREGRFTPCRLENPPNQSCNFWTVGTVVIRIPNNLAPTRRDYVKNTGTHVFLSGLFYSLEFTTVTTVQWKKT